MAGLIWIYCRTLIPETVGRYLSIVSGHSFAFRVSQLKSGVGATNWPQPYLQAAANWSCPIYSLRAAYRLGRLKISGPVLDLQLLAGPLATGPPAPRPPAHEPPALRRRQCGPGQQEWDWLKGQFTIRTCMPQINRFCVVIILH